MKVLFATPHGSTLYGLATPTSDHDFYRVVVKMPNIYEVRPKKYAKQSIRGLDDVLTVDFSTWMKLCEKGVPQALEAMWSSIPTEDEIGDFRAAYRVGTAVIPTYLRTIKGFCFKGEHDRKYRRHAARLALNANSILERGYFHPTLSEDEVVWVKSMGDPQRGPEDLLADLNDTIWRTA